MTFYQYALTTPWIAGIISFLLAILILQSWKFIRISFKWLFNFFRSILLRFSWGNFILISFFAFGLFTARFRIADLYFKVQDYLNPIYAGQFDGLGLEHETAIFEQVIRERNDEYTTQIIKKRIGETAVKMGCPSLWFYMAGLGECGLNPYVVRSDKVAASWCQLTKAGLTGIKINGKQALMFDVIEACKNRDIELIMSLNDAYLIDRWMLQGSPKLNGPVDVYLLLFAPSKVCSPPETILYQGYSNPSYYLNAGLDGFKRLPDGRISYSNAQKDGKITVEELALRVESIKNQLLKSKLK